MSLKLQVLELAFPSFSKMNLASVSRIVPANQSKQSHKEQVMPKHIFQPNTNVPLTVEWCLLVCLDYEEDVLMCNV